MHNGKLSHSRYLPKHLTVAEKSCLSEKVEDAHFKPNKAVLGFHPEPEEVAPSIHDSSSTAKEAANIAPTESVAIGVAETATEDLEMGEDDTSYGQSSNVSLNLRPMKETALSSHISKIVAERKTKLVSLVYQYNEAASTRGI
ncbi:uncharacterized protein RHIMIDRAFT_235767 [Rhizopus microsporus ATCC 52813]|uniref:Uncharacterized protein n=1 Tax=Rhizopus microsporus ATCC 52813 TaxID=1340429 RepID=A0A2G4T1V9_RHIZD|nr:uncharacterized protein RHIMIDRAFT_235767 [Rhizopus microsporus ATCC 52813]PHZ15010.1 hypothetical protein RHIMIDRAFT_235767 [Rhizopus microsporus ATCC 52813]